MSPSLPSREIVGERGDLGADSAQAFLPQRPAAGRTGLDVDAEDALEALRPSHRRPALRRRFLLLLLEGFGFGARPVRRWYASVCSARRWSGPSPGWRGRRQHFCWVNDIDYDYGKGQKHRLRLHVVGCEESWQEVDPDTGEIVDKHAHHAWLSSEPLNRRNVHERCHLGARQRWRIETGFLIEKHQGYCYEHAFSHDWNAMRGYHYLMRLAHLSNAPGLATKRVKTYCRAMGVQAFLRWVRESCANRFA